MANSGRTSRRAPDQGDSRSRRRRRRTFHVARRAGAFPARHAAPRGASPPCPASESRDPGARRLPRACRPARSTRCPRSSPMRTPRSPASTRPPARGRASSEAVSGERAGRPRRSRRTAPWSALRCATTCSRPCPATSASVPCLSTISVFYSDTVEGTPKSSQLHHCDGDDVTQVKIFVYCSDVDVASGPLTVLGAEHSARVRRAIRYQYRAAADRRSGGGRARAAAASMPSSGPSGTIGVRGYEPLFPLRVARGAGRAAAAGDDDPVPDALQLHGAGRRQRPLVVPRFDRPSLGRCSVWCSVIKRLWSRTPGGRAVESTARRRPPADRGGRTARADAAQGGGAAEEAARHRRRERRGGPPVAGRQRRSADDLRGVAERVRDADARVELLERFDVGRRTDAKWRKIFSNQLTALLRHVCLPLDRLPPPHALNARRFRLRSQNEEDGVLLALLESRGLGRQRASSRSDRASPAATPPAWRTSAAGRAC